jgi:hypothetical protein
VCLPDLERRLDLLVLWRLLVQEILLGLLALLVRLDQ